MTEPPAPAGPVDDQAGTAHASAAGLGPARLAGRWRRVAADLTPLRQNPAYRRLWAGNTVSTVGSQMTTVAVQIQVFGLTHSSLDVGLIGAVSLVGMVGFGLIGGALADAVDRRRFALCTSSGLAACSAVLLLQAALGLRLLWLIYLVVGVQGALFACDSAARNAVVPRLLPLDQLPAGNALSQVSMNAGLTCGPLLSGLLVASVGLFAAYLADVVSFTASLYALWRLPSIPPPPGAQRAGVASVREGLRFLRGRPVLLMTFLVDINAMVFGMPRALFPALAGSFFHGGPGVVGVLNASPAIGALAGAAVSGGLGRVRRQGLAVLGAVAVWGAAVTGFGFTRTLWLGMLLLAVAGAADMVSAVFRGTILQVLTPDTLRGRLQGVYIIVVAGGPRLGDVESGTVATLVNPAFSVVSGGLACLAGVALLGLAVPAFARYDAARAARAARAGAVA